MSGQNSITSKRAAPNAGTLYVVATPIGNLDDFSKRARDILVAADLLLVEDTRRSAKLLSYYGINCGMQALHEHNERRQIRRVIQQLQQGAVVALLSDAGTPLISDPGFALVEAAHKAGISVRAVPGPSALTAALSIAALPVDRFCFEGFLPSNKAARRSALAVLLAETRTMVFFEAPHRICAFAADACMVFGADREVAVVKEISKIHESVWRGTLGNLQDWLNGAHSARGEFVVLIAGTLAARCDAVEVERIMRIVAAKLPPRDAAVVVAEITGWGSRELYDMATTLK